MAIRPTSRDDDAQVLDTGALPLPILERKIHDWEAAKLGKDGR